jgi:hypothetical protein
MEVVPASVVKMTRRSVAAKEVGASGRVCHWFAHLTFEAVHVRRTTSPAQSSASITREWSVALSLTPTSPTLM